MFHVNIADRVSVSILEPEFVFMYFHKRLGHVLSVAPVETGVASEASDAPVTHVTKGTPSWKIRSLLLDLLK